MDPVIEEIFRLDPTSLHSYGHAQSHTFGIVSQEEYEPYTYGDDYWTLYQDYAQSPIAPGLRKLRLQDLMEISDETYNLLDIGIGNGQFAHDAKREEFTVYAYDINPRAVTYIKKNFNFLNPNTDTLPSCVLTMYDTLEHIPQPSNLLRRWPVGTYLIVSLPIFTSFIDLRKSKHFKPNEHLHYFTASGLIFFMSLMGYFLISAHDKESQLGRDSIQTFTFQKKL